MSEFKRAELQRFVWMREKSYPPVFVGRQVLLDEILTIARMTGAEGVGIPGNTTVIQGAPGSGKSSVLSELEIRAPRAINARVVNIANTDLEQNIPDVTRAIAFAASRDNAQWFDIWSQSGPEWLQRLPQMKGFNIPRYESLIDLQRYRPASTWTAPVIVAVDEAQRFPENKSAPYAQFMQEIHDAKGVRLPLTLVLAGLGDTQSVIRSMGLTHGLRPHPLGCFDAEELDELTGAWCAHFGITVGAQRDRIDRLMSPTDGWPRHVHWAQQALAEALLVPGVDGDADRITDWTTVHHRSDQLRHGYYQTQFSDVMVSSRKLVGRVMLDMANAQRDGDGLTFDQVVDVVEIYNGYEPGSAWRVPEKESKQSYVTHLIHCGALQRRSMDPSDHVLTCPIPSFQSYIIAQGGFEVPAN